MDSPLVHFLVPYVGRLDYLQECVESVQAQTDSRWRLTVVEDGDQGTNASEWVRGFHDVRLEHRLNPERLGVARNFQRCLELAQAPFLVIMGCDDRLLPTYLETVAQLLRAAPEASLVQPGVQVIDEAGRPRRGLTDWTKTVLSPRARLSRLQGEEAAASVMRGNWMYFPSLCWRTATIQRAGFRDDLPTTLDLDLICRLVLAGESVAVAPRDVVFQYRRHRRSASSVTAQELSRFAEERRLFAELESAFRSRGWYKAARLARWHPTSRVHALTLLPQAVFAREERRVQQILAHAAGGTAARPGPPS